MDYQFFVPRFLFDGGVCRIIRYRTSNEVYTPKILLTAPPFRGRRRRYFCCCRSCTCATATAAVAVWCRCRTAVDYAAAYGRLDTLSCLIAYGCEISDQTVTTLLSGDLAVGASAFNRCIWKGITTARYTAVAMQTVSSTVARLCFRERKYDCFKLKGY